MSLGLSDQRRRSGKRRRVIRSLLMVVVIAAAGVIGYNLGVYRAERPVREFEDRIAELEADNESMNQEIQELVSVVANVQEQKAALDSRYARDVPDEAQRRLLALATAKLSEGISRERLAFVIGAVENERKCDGEPVTKRFIVQTPLHDGANSSVGFSNGAVTVTGTGESAVNPSGAPEAWYDPAASVSMRFTHIGGKSVEVAGALPLQKSLVAGGVEYRFVVAEGPQGFALVSSDRCDYP